MEKICLTGDKWKLNLTDGDILRSRIALVQGSANFSGTSNLYDYQLDWRISNETTGENFPVELRVSEGQIQLKSLVALQLGANSLRLHESGADQLTIITWKISRSNIDNKRRFVRPVYLVNSEMVGPSKVEENLKRIDLAVELLQTALTSCIQQRFGVSKTFRIESNSHHQPICRVLNCPRLISMSALDFYWSIVTRLCKHTWKNDCGKSSEMKFLVFVDPSVFNMAECNFGTGDVAIVGANCLDVWPVRLQDIQSRFRDNSEHINCPLERRCQGCCYSETVGAALHELLHIFDLVHSETGVMNLGYRNFGSLWSFFATKIQDDYDSCHLRDSDNLILFHHRYFSSDCEDIAQILYRNKTLISPDGLVLVELRSPDGSALLTWNFGSDYPKFWSPPFKSETDFIGNVLFAISQSGSSIRVTL